MTTLAAVVSVDDSSCCNSSNEQQLGYLDNGVRPPEHRATALVPVSNIPRPLHHAQARQAVQSTVNKLGGVFENGRPLPEKIRIQIIAMTQQGIRPCEISRQLRVSHGCISKIINRYTKTGSILPGPSGTSRTRATTSIIMQAIAQYRRENSSIGALEVRQRLIADNICSDQNMPSWINRLVNKSLQSATVPERILPSTLCLSNQQPTAVINNAPTRVNADYCSQKSHDFEPSMAMFFRKFVRIPQHLPPTQQCFHPAVSSLIPRQQVYPGQQHDIKVPSGCVTLATHSNVATAAVVGVDSSQFPVNRSTSVERTADFSCSADDISWPNTSSTDIDDVIRQALGATDNEKSDQKAVVATNTACFKCQTIDSIPYCGVDDITDFEHLVP